MSTRERVLSALRDAGESGISGEELAGALGVSRVAVGKHVTALRDLGYDVHATPGSGYRLLQAPDAAYPWEVEPLVREELWLRPFGGGPSTASTNDDARTLAEQGAREGTVVVAARQQAGRGRFGRVWSSPEGGAYVSVVLRPAVAPADAGTLALVVALGIAEGLEALGVPARLKWPNDVKSPDGKLAGVLLEMSAEADAVRWIVAGFGLNVARPAQAGDSSTPNGPGFERRQVAYVRDYAPDVAVGAAAAACLDGVARCYAKWLGGGFMSLVADYERRSVLTGERVVVSNALGAAQASGVVRGVDGEGRLLVDTGGAVEAVTSGEITLRA